MKSLINTNLLFFVILAPVLMLVSCSSSYKLSYNGHLNLVKAGKTKLSSEPSKIVKEDTVAEITPIHSSLTVCKQKNAKVVLLPAVTKHLRLCRVALNSAKSIKQLNPVQVNRSLVKYHGNPWDDDNDLIMNPPRIILIAGILTLVTVICFVYAVQMPFLNFLGYLLAAAAITFLVIWVLSLNDYHTY